MNRNLGVENKTFEGLNLELKGVARSVFCVSPKFSYFNRQKHNGDHVTYFLSHLSTSCLTSYC